MMTNGQKGAYQRYLDAKFKPTPNGRYSASALAEMQLAFLDALKSNDPLPIEMQQHLSFAFADLCAGFSNELLTIPFRGSMKPIKTKLQEDAIRYLRWVKDGRIDDPLAVENIAQWYGVGERQVRRWVADWADRPTPKLHEDFGEKTVIAAAKQSGARYYKW